MVFDRLAEDELMGHVVCRASSPGRRGAWGSFDDFVGAGKDAVWDRQAERLGGLQIDD